MLRCQHEDGRSVGAMAVPRPHDEVSRQLARDISRTEARRDGGMVIDPPKLKVTRPSPSPDPVNLSPRGDAMCGANTRHPVCPQVSVRTNDDRFVHLYTLSELAAAVPRAAHDREDGAADARWHSGGLEHLHGVLSGHAARRLPLCTR